MKSAHTPQLTGADATPRRWT